VSTRSRSRTSSAAGEARSWKGRHDALLDVLAAVLYARGEGPDHRLAVAHVHYRGRKRRPVVLEDLGNRLVIRFEGQDTLETLETPELSRWERILGRIRRWIGWLT